MQIIIIFAVIALAVASDMDPKCFVKPPYVNPRTCCLDPAIVKDDLHEKCMRKVFQPPTHQIIDDTTEEDHSETNLIPNTDTVIKNRQKRSVDELSSSIDLSHEKKFNRNNANDDDDDDDDDEIEEQNSNSDISSSSDESIEKRPHKHHRHHSRPHKYRRNNGRRYHHGKNHHGKHHHGKHHNGRHHHRHRHHHHHPRYHFDDRYIENRNEYDDTYAPVFHRDFAKWSSISARFQKLSIYWNCVFNETGIIDPNHNVVMSNVKSYLEEVLDTNTQFIPIMEDAFETCKIKREEFMEDQREAKEHYILDSTPMERHLYRKEHPQLNLNTNKFNETNHAYFLIRCVKRVTYKNCPDDKFRLDDKLCSKSRAYLKNCPYSARQYYQRN